MTNKRQFTDIPNQQENTILEVKYALNTKRKTKQAVWLFRKYLREKEVNTDSAGVEFINLAGILPTAKNRSDPFQY
jgi:predicted Zn-dependent protease